MSLMKNVCAALLLVMGAYACDGAEAPEPLCDGHALGESWGAADGCNTCLCESTGISCTEMSCPGPDACDDGHLPGDSWPSDDGCNTCTCTDELAIACTLMPCVGECDGGYLVGETWLSQDGCNTCGCAADLTIECTEMACIEETCDDGHLPGESWPADDGCNTCTCSDDLKIGCTKMYCGDACDDGHKPGESWDAGDGCNECTCTESLEVQCTLADCTPVTCEELTALYGDLVEQHKSCKADADCQWLNGYCGVGIGGCYEIVNGDLPQAALAEVADQFNALNCATWVCDCAMPPEKVWCQDGLCTAIWSI
jgi:hypothetical protein